MSDLAERLRASTNYDDRSDAADLIEAQAVRIAELEAALHKIADRTKRAHPQAQEGEIHQIAITALTNNTQEKING